MNLIIRNALVYTLASMYAGHLKVVVGMLLEFHWGGGKCPLLSPPKRNPGLCIYFMSCTASVYTCPSPVRSRLKEVNL